MFITWAKTQLNLFKVGLLKHKIFTSATYVLISSHAWFMFGPVARFCSSFMSVLLALAVSFKIVSSCLETGRNVTHIFYVSEYLRTLK